MHNFDTTNDINEWLGVLKSVSFTLAKNDNMFGKFRRKLEEKIWESWENRLISSHATMHCGWNSLQNILILRVFPERFLNFSSNLPQNFPKTLLFFASVNDALSKTPNYSLIASIVEKLCTF